MCVTLLDTVLWLCADVLSGTGCNWSPACLARLAGGPADGSKVPPPSDGVPLNTLLNLKEDCMVSRLSFGDLNSLQRLYQFFSFYSSYKEATSSKALSADLP